jgi:hypothetical protein
MDRCGADQSCALAHFADTLDSEYVWFMRSGSRWTSSMTAA